MEVRKTDGNFATAQIPNTGLSAGNYKIIVFPKAMELKSYYVKADAQGNIAVAYKLEEAIEVEPVTKEQFSATENHQRIGKPGNKCSCGICSLNCHVSKE